MSDPSEPDTASRQLRPVESGVVDKPSQARAGAGNWDGRASVGKWGGRASIGGWNGARVGGLRTGLC